jgi:hypothetical protein
MKGGIYTVKGDDGNEIEKEYHSSYGYAVVLIHNHAFDNGGYNEITVQYGNGTGSDFSPRAYVTCAIWSDDFKGLVGGEAYENDTEGLSAGVQIEA